MCYTFRRGPEKVKREVAGLPTPQLRRQRRQAAAAAEEVK